MLVFRNCGGELPITKCLREIILDDPKLKADTKNIDSFSMAFGALRYATREGGIGDIPINKRQCADNCSCVDEYNSNLKRTATMFSLRD